GVSGLFFFQAEDGIRDFHVTGVQTCALPISLPAVHAKVGGVLGDQVDLLDARADELLGLLHDGLQGAGAVSSADLRDDAEGTGEIGRASCRGRGWGAGVKGAVMKKGVHGTSR